MAPLEKGKQKHIHKPSIFRFHVKFSGGAHPQKMGQIVRFQIEVSGSHSLKLR